MACGFRCGMQSTTDLFPSFSFLVLGFDGKLWSADGGGGWGWSKDGSFLISDCQYICNFVLCFTFLFDNFV